MNPKEFIDKFHTLLPDCPPEAAQLWYDFAIACVEQKQYVHFKASENREVSVENWLEVLYKGLRQTKETFGAKLATKVGSLSCEGCCLYPGEMPGAAECLREGDSTQEIWAKIESGKFDYPDPFSAIPSKTLPANIYMSEQEFTAHMDKLIPAPSVETNRNLLNLANGLWLDMNDNLYHAFSFVSRHFTTETLFYTTHFGRIDPQKLLDTAISRADRTGTTAADALQQIDYNQPER